MDNIKLIDFRMEKNSDRNSNGLHISIGSLPFDFSLPGLHIVDDGLLDDRDFEIISFFESSGR